MISWGISILVWLALAVGRNSETTTCDILSILGTPLENKTEGNLNLILTLSNSLAPVLKPFKSKSFPTQAARVEAVTSALKNATAAWQAPVLAALKPFNVQTKAFWISNQIYVKNASPKVVEVLKELGVLKSILGEIILPLLPPINPSKGTPPNGETQWGVKKIKANDVWSKYKAEGEGIRVGVIDTGVRGTHKALTKNYVGMNNNGWFDPITCKPVPTDNVGHGTHCTGTICGDDGTGVARMSKWMACRGCAKTGCPQSALLTCSEFMLEPTDAKGDKPDSTKHAHIVSNSWGGGQNQVWYNNAIQAFKAAGVLGPACETANSPGDQLDVTSLGSTNQQDKVSDFSSRGPNKADNGIVSPLLVTPGEDINSAYYTGDDHYQILSGTSMATPHAAGAAALLLSKYPELMNLDNMQYLLFSTATRIYTGLQCGDTPADACPNEISGYGLINLLSAFDMMANVKTILNVTASPLLTKSFRCLPN